MRQTWLRRRQPALAGLLVMSLVSLLILLQPPSAWAERIGPGVPQHGPGDETIGSDTIDDGSANGTGRTSILTYVVQAGDSLWTIAARFGIDVETLRWANPEVARNPDYLRIEQELIILPVRGAYVTVEPGDTAESLAGLWGVAPDDIVNYPLNQLGPGQALIAGSKLVIPYGRREVKLAPPSPAAGYPYAWPIRGYVTQGYSAHHKAVDLGAPYGANVYAARDGRCISALWSRTGYGYLIILVHDDGSRTYYGHLKGAWVKPGQWVKRGALVGEVGSTGNSTGPHVHFGIRIAGVAQNPLDYLPATP